MTTTAAKRRAKARGKGKPQHRPAKITAAARLRDDKRAWAILEAREKGKSLRVIGKELTPSITPGRVHQIINEFMALYPAETVEQVRAMELMRLDKMQAGGLWEQAVAGDVQSINTMLAIMRRRAQIMGVDLQPMVGRGDATRFGTEDAPVEQLVRVEIVGNPQIERVRWLEAQVLKRADPVIPEDAPPGTTGYRQ